MLLRNGNRYALISMRNSVTLKESYESVKNVLEKLKYEDYCWMICVDLKVMQLFWNSKVATRNTIVFSATGIAE